MTTLDGLLVAGGKSRRMGRSKATLLVEGEPLWQRTLRLLRECGCDRLFVAAPERPEWLPPGAEWLADPGRGPLGGIAAGLAATRADHLLALAVDLPGLTRDFLIRHASERQKDRSLIPKRAQWFEGLCAFYASNARTTAERLARSEDRSLQNFVRELLETDRADTPVIPEDEAHHLRNWNSPD